MRWEHEWWAEVVAANNLLVLLLRQTNELAGNATGLSSELDVHNRSTVFIKPFVMMNVHRLTITPDHSIDATDLISQSNEVF